MTSSIKALFSGVCLAATLCCTGCQTDVGGVTTASTPYLTEGIEYYPTGPKFKLTDEAAAMKAHTEQQRRQQFADDETRPAIEMKQFTQPSGNGGSVNAD